MRKLIIVLIASASLWTVSLAAAQKDQTFTGEIMDQQCAVQGGHSAMMNPGESAKDCTNKCVSAGGQYVLFDSAAKTFHLLDDQDKPQAFAGAKVQVTGTYDKSSNTIHVSSIKAGS
jgi:type 1 fimbria pilin